MHINWAEIPAVYLVSHQRFPRNLMSVCTPHPRVHCMHACVCAHARATVCVCACLSVSWAEPTRYYSRNGLQRFGGYLFLLVNCEADSIESLGQFKWAFSQITSVIAYIQVPGCSYRDRAWEALKFSGEGQI